MKSKRFLLWSLVVIVSLILAFFLLNLFVKNELQKELSGLEHPVDYEDLDVNLLLNTFSLSEVRTRQENLDLSIQKVQISGLSYYQFLLNDEIRINDIELDQPQIIYLKKDSTNNDTSQQRHIRVRSLSLKNGNLSRKNSDTSEIDLYVRIPEAVIGGIESGKAFRMDSYRASVDSVYLKMNAEHYIDIGNAEAEDGRVELTNFRIVPFDTKADFDRKIPYEKDRISLEVEAVKFEDLKVDTQNDTLLLKEPKMTISEAFLEIYRNKLIKDDVRRKPLYNELLREAPFKLHVEEVLVEKSEIIYEELIQEGRDAAVIRFTDVSAEIKNIHNRKNKELPQPSITARANFMRGTPVHLTWTFPVFDRYNNFSISGGFGTLEGAALDPFLIPALDLQVRGNINEINFDFRGNEDTMKGKFQLNYDELEVELLKEEGEEKRSFFSAIANLFVKNKAEPVPENESIEVERDKQRSFWNFIWLGLREGFLDTLSRL